MIGYSPPLVDFLRPSSQILCRPYVSLPPTGLPTDSAIEPDLLAGVAQGNGRFLRPKTATELASIKPGYLFLVRKTNNNWAHIGIVEAVQGEAMLTIEGNTNDSGSAEGFEVCRRTRGIKDKDYLPV